VKRILHKSRYCCNLSVGVALNVWFTTNGMCAKNNNVYMWRGQAIIEWSWHVIFIVASCHSVKLCAYAARDFPIATIFTRSRWSQSHNNNGFLKLVEALLQIYSCLFSHSVKLYVVYRYQQCHCLAALPAKMSMCNSHMQGSHSVISNKLRLHTKINPYSYNKNSSSPGGTSGALTHI